MISTLYDFEQNEEMLLAEIQNDNRKAWEFLMQKFYPMLYSFILGMVKNNEIAEELLQDIFVNFWTKRQKIQINTSLKAYLYRAARNHTLNFIKRRKFEQDYQKSLAQNMTQSKNLTEDDYIYTELEKRLHRAIEELPESCKEIFKLSRFAEMTYKEISETMGVPVRTVHYQIGLALKELRQKLRGDFGENIMLISWLIFLTIFLSQTN